MSVFSFHQVVISQIRIIGAASDWELSQFELSGGYLIPAPVSNTPRNISNSPPDTYVFSFLQGADAFALTEPIGYLNVNSDGVPLIDWIYSVPGSVTFGNHNLPLSYTYGAKTVYRAGTARMDMEAFHFWELPWYSSSTTHYTHIPMLDSNRGYDKNLRVQFSVNTCQGCHGGENKTVFTQMRPLGYGQPARYWLSTPDDDYGQIDTGRFANNWGYNKFNWSTVGDEQPNYLITADSQHYPRVSAFLTGRRLAGVGSGSWQDDLVDLGVDDGNDHLLDDPLSLFYVFDPTAFLSNETYGDPLSYLLPESVTGFNDLERRKKDLCKFLNKKCRADVSGIISTSLSITQSVIFIPLPMSGH